MFSPVFVCLSVCLLARLFKKRAWVWMKCCVSTDVGAWTKWLTFEPDSDYSPDAGTGLLSPTSYALQRGIVLRPENPTYSYWAPVTAATRGFKMVLFTASCGNNIVGGKCAPPSALLVFSFFAADLSLTMTVSCYCVLTVIEIARLAAVCLLSHSSVSTSD